MRNLISLALICIFTFCATGCFKTYQEIRLKSDLSGQIYLRLVYDMNTIVDMMGAQQGGGQVPEKQKKMMTEQMKSQMKAESKAMKEEINKKLPEGVKLAEFSILEPKPGKMEMKIGFSFKHIDCLKAMQDLEFGPQQGDAQKPFQGLTIEQEGSDIIIKQNMKTDPKMQQGSEQMESMPGMEEMMEMMLKEMGFFVRIRVPYMKYKIAEHTADKYDEANHTLYWSYTGKALMESAKTGKMPKEVFVRLTPKQEE